MSGAQDKDAKRAIKVIPVGARQYAGFDSQQRRAVARGTVWALGPRRMRLVELVLVATAAPLREESVVATCKAESIDRQRLYDAFAEEVAYGYRSGKYSWLDADVAINHLFSFAYAITGEGLSDYAFLVYDAFDQGEYQAGGEAVTIDLLSKLDDAEI
jgi:hypothetical protein